jgi:hypothetical protein
MNQVMKYSDRCGADEADLVVIDRREEVPWDEKVFCEKKEPDMSGEMNRLFITVWGMYNNS